MAEPEAPAPVGRHSPRPFPLVKYNVTKRRYRKVSPHRGIYAYLRNKPLVLMTDAEFQLILRLLLRTAKPVLVTGRGCESGNSLRGERQ